jgi:hypothetical protein
MDGEKLRTCNVCGAEGYEGGAFYQSVTSRCKECHKAKVRENRADNADYYKAYDRSRHVGARREYTNAMSRRCPNEAKRRYGSAYRRKNPEKIRAHYAIRNAVRSGRLIRPSHCHSCGVFCTPHGHHDDYSRPLDVEWLCHECHYDAHVAINAERRGASPFMRRRPRRYNYASQGE